MPIVARLARYWIWLATVLACSCAPIQLASQESLENKLANVKLGVTTKDEVENLFGREHGGEGLRWIYTLSGTSSNTRALITVRFTVDGSVNALEVARYFDPPFINDYWYLTERQPQTILQVAARAGEAADFHLLTVDKSAGGLLLEDGATKGQITVAVDKNILHLRSTNPHTRLANEYRAFGKREGLFMERLSAALAKPETAASSVAATPSAPSPPAREAANLSWKNNGGNAEGFRVYRITGKQKTKIAELRSDVTSYTDKDAPPKACYVVTAFNAAGESPATSQVCLPD